MKEIRIFAPATVANLSCGFDVLGCCLNSIGDEMILRKNDISRIRITSITGQKLPTDPKRNVAGVAITSLLKNLGYHQGFDIEIVKNIKPGSGIGSSAASSAGAVFAVNELLEKPFESKDLIPFAMEGERVASGNAHADNVSPALLGGFTLVKTYDPLEVLRLPVLNELRIVVLHPMIELKTKESRAIIKENISLKKATAQWGNLGAFVSALYTEDYDLLGRSLKDEIVEPVRSILIPFFDHLKKIALAEGALGCGISGSGPSVFAMCRGNAVAQRIYDSFQDFYADKLIEYDLHLSAINTTGIKIL